MGGCREVSFYKIFFLLVFFVFLIYTWDSNTWIFVNMFLLDLEDLINYVLLFLLWDFYGRCKIGFGFYRGVGED